MIEVTRLIVRECLWHPCKHPPTHARTYLYVAVGSVEWALVRGGEGGAGAGARGEATPQGEEEVGGGGQSVDDGDVGAGHVVVSVVDLIVVVVVMVVVVAVDGFKTEGGWYRRRLP